MSVWAGLECWSDDSDPEARQDAEADAREDSLLTADPPPAGALPECVVCGGLGGRCCEVAAMERPQEVMP